ncbi:hypothetical protein GCM10007979_34830 [Nocardioides albus]|nr:hypothetical protein GCM10007979_34830 [Nocardioides albus]
MSVRASSLEDFHIRSPSVYMRASNEPRGDIRASRGHDDRCSAESDARRFDRGTPGESSAKVLRAELLREAIASNAEQRAQRDRAI